MKIELLNTRELSKETARVLRELPETGPRIITRGCEVVGLLIAPSKLGIEADLDLLSRLRFGQAIAQMQADAAQAGTDSMTMDEINAEIDATRAERRQKAKEK